MVTHDDESLYAMPTPRASQAVYERGPLSVWQQMGISREFIDKAFRSASCEGAFKVQYIGGQLYSCDAWPDPRKGFPHTLFYTRRLHVMKLLHDAFLSPRSAPAADSVPIGEWEAVFCLGDCVASQLPFARERHIGSTYQLAPDPAAAFVPVSCPGSMNIPFPIWENNGHDRWDTWDQYTELIRDNARRWPWSTRRPQAVFRGAQRTCTILPEDLLALSGDHDGASKRSVSSLLVEPRRFNGVQLNQPDAVAARFDSTGVPAYVARAHNASAVCGRTAIAWQAGQSRQYRDRFNVSMTGGYWSVYAKSTDRRFADGFARDSPRHMPMSAMEQFKYIVWGEGNCGYAHRLRMMLHMGAVIIKPHSPELCVEPYALQMRPFVHFVPVDRRFSNLTHAIRWIDDHPERVKDIRRNSRLYGRTHVSQMGFVRYVRQLFFVYSQLLLFKVSLCPAAQKFVSTHSHVNSTHPPKW